MNFGWYNSVYHTYHVREREACPHIFSILTNVNESEFRIIGRNKRPLKADCHYRITCPVFILSRASLRDGPPWLKPHLITATFQFISQKILIRYQFYSQTKGNFHLLSENQSSWQPCEIFTGRIIHYKYYCDDYSVMCLCHGLYGNKDVS